MSLLRPEMFQATSDSTYAGLLSLSRAQSQMQLNNIVDR